MAKTKKVASSVVLNDLDDVNNTLAELADLRRGVRVREANLNQRIDELKAEADAAIAPSRERINELEQGLMRWADYNRPVHFRDDGRRSVTVTFGIVGFRRSTALKPVPKWTWAAVLASLKALKLTAAVRVKEEVDREEMEGWSETKLEQVGVRRVEADNFFYELDETQLGTS